MTRAEAIERMAHKLTIWRDRIDEKLEMARLLRGSDTRMGVELAQSREQEAQALARDVLALELVLSLEVEHA